MVRKVVLWILVLACAGVIFMFSGQVAQKSNEVSKGVTSKLLEHTQFYQKLTPPEQAKMVAKFNGYVRALAHFSFFLLLGALLALLLRAYEFHRPYATAFLICVVYALADETHQLFSDGRSFQLVDLLKDWSGSLLGIGMIAAVCRLIRRAKRKRAGSEASV